MQTPTSRTTARRRWVRCLGTGATVIVAATTAASVAGAAAPTSADIPTSGSVAALSASSMEVQNPSTGQTTVNWTPTTQFSKTVTQPVSSITVGSCVTATGTPSKKSKTTIAVSNISVTQASSTGSCTQSPTGTRIGGAPGAGFQFRTGPGGGFATRSGNGSPPKNPGAAIRNRLGNFTIASGKVTAVNGSTLSVSGVSLSPGSFRRPTSKESKDSKKPTPPKPENLKLTTSSSTTVSATQSATSSDLAVGDCVIAFGPAASNGSVTADNVRITSTNSNSCTGGFTKFGGGGGGGGGPTIFGGPGGGDQGFAQVPTGGGGA